MTTFLSSQSLYTRGNPSDLAPLLVCLTLLNSDKTLGSLARHIQAALEPEDLVTGNGDSTEQKKPQLTLVAIENAILTIAERRNYGVDWLGRPSASLSIWRWELKEQRMDWLPKSLRVKLESRIAERRQVRGFYPGELYIITRDTGKE